MPERVRVTLIIPEWHTWTARARYLREVGDAPFTVVSRAFHARAHLDVLWFPWNGCSWTKFSLPAVATLHDATNFVIPGYAPETQSIFRAAATHCSTLITDSRFSQGELARALGIPPERIVPIHLGVDPPSPVAIAPALDTSSYEPYILFVGTSERRKGVDVLIAALNRLKSRHPRLTLVLTGARGDAVDGTEPISVRELGFVDDRALITLYRHASVFAFPSRYEGFGLPVLEAMAHGIPVVTTNTTALPEAAGDAALYVPPDDTAALADAIERILLDEDLAASLRARGIARAQEMSWAKTADATLAVLERAAR